MCTVIIKHLTHQLAYVAFLLEHHIAETIWNKKASDPILNSVFQMDYTKQID